MLADAARTPFATSRSLALAALTVCLIFTEATPAAALQVKDAAPSPDAQAPAPLAASALETAAETYRRVRQLYQESCENRAYGAYDDICEALGKEVRRTLLEYDALKHKDDGSKPSRP